MDKRRHFDQLLEGTGPYGFYQGLLFVLFQWNIVALSTTWIAGIYMLGRLEPEYICHDPDFNSTDTCDMIRNCSNLTINSVYRSVYQEFEWACLPSHQVNTLTSVLPAAELIGHVVGGHLADWLGRQPLVFAGILASCAASLTASWTQTWPQYFIAVLFSSFAYPLSYDTGVALAMETVGTKYRLLQNFASQWTFAYIANSIIGYFAADWRLHLRIVFFSLIPLLVIWVFVAESPRWLMQKRKYKRATGALNRMAWCNCRGANMYTEEMVGLHEEEQESHIQYNFFHMFYSKKLVLYTIVQFSTGICINLIYSLILISVQELSGSPFLNVCLFGLLRVWSPFAVVIIDRYAVWFGRRALFLASQGVVIGCLTAIAVLYAIAGGRPSGALGVLFSVLAQLCHAVVAGVVWVAYQQFTTELYPTAIRGIALSACALVSLGGTILAPQLLSLKSAWSFEVLPWLVAGGMAALCWCFVYALLPETRDRTLPDSLGDIAASDATVASSPSLEVDKTSTSSDEQSSNPIVPLMSAMRTRQARQLAGTGAPATDIETTNAAD